MPIAASLPLHLRGRLARKLFLRFVVAAAVPLAGLAVYSYHLLSQVLRDGLRTELRNDAKALGMEIVGDLRQRATLLSALHAGPELPQGLGFLITEHEDEQVLLARLPELTESLNTHGVALDFKAKEGIRIFVRDERGGAVSGLLDENTLWQRDIVRPPYCLLMRNNEVLYCSQGFARVPPRGAQFDDGKEALRDPQGDALIATRWQANLQGLFGDAGFVVLIARSERELQAPLSRLRTGFLTLLVLAVAMAVMFAMTQLRRQLQPLDDLSKAADRIAGGELEVQVAERGSDELAVLGRTFNRMVRALSAKFLLLRLLADLDRAILDGTSRRQMAARVLDDLLSACMAKDGGLLFIGDSGETFFFRARMLGGEIDDPRTLAADEVGKWANFDAESPFAIPRDVLSTLAGATERPDVETHAFPLREDRKTRGFLLLAGIRNEARDDEIRRAGESLAHRLSVAGSNKAREEAFYRQTHFSPLTGLPNRIMLRDRVAQAVLNSDRRGAFALMLIDFDGFRLINEAMSRQAGDNFLIEVAKRLSSLAAAADTVAHLGADSFALLKLDLSGEGRELQLHGAVERIQRALGEPVDIGGRPVLAQARIGIALHPDNARDFDSLVDSAGVALRHAKAQDGIAARFFSADMNSAVAARFELSQDLHTAIARDELLLYFQPKVEAAGEGIAGAEALIRWNSPTRGLVSPGAFLPVLEEMGLNRWLTDFVLDRACYQMRYWKDEGYPPVSVSVNVPPDELLSEDFEQRVEKALDRHGVGHGRLEIEILESSETDGARVKDRLERLRERGVKVSLDDFGTGYSSLVYLTAMPADTLKLDRAFIRYMVGDARQQSIVRQVISLAHSLGFTVVAEGVEEVAQRDLLVAMGCDQIQGYLFSPPLPADTFIQKLLSCGKAEAIVASV